MTARGGAAAKVREIIDRRYPCQELPHGALTAIAEEVGVSRQRVQQIVAKRGLTVSRRGHLPSTTLYECRYCKAPFTKANKSRSGMYCSVTCGVADRTLHLICDQCGKPFSLSGQRRTVWLANRKRSPTLLRTYCSRACMAASIRGLPSVGAGERRRP